VHDKKILFSCELSYRGQDYVNKGYIVFQFSLFGYNELDFEIYRKSFLKLTESPNQDYPPLTQVTTLSKYATQGTIATIGLRHRAHCKNKMLPIELFVVFCFFFHFFFHSSIIFLNVLILIMKDTGISVTIIQGFLVF
jgi:hypothetical protein